MRRMDPGLKPASTTDAAAKPSPYDGGTLQQWAPTACSKYTADLRITLSSLIYMHVHTVYED